MIPQTLIPAFVEDARCAGVDPEMWFPAKGASDTSQAARRICSRCPVLAECREYALKDASLDGIWGGMTVLERSQERVRRRTGRAS